MWRLMSIRTQKSCSETRGSAASQMRTRFTRLMAPWKDSKKLLPEIEGGQPPSYNGARSEGRRRLPLQGGFL